MPIVKIIGLGLSILYAVSCVTFYQYLKIFDLEFNLIFFSIFGMLFISSLGLLTLREWARRFIVITNGLMFFLLVINFIAKVGVIHVSYVFMTVVVLLYFNQSTIKLQFYRRSVSSWKSILCVDDDETIIKIIRPLLMSYGYSVLTAKTGEMGLEIAKQQKPDLILLDVILPGIKGREVCKILKREESTKNIPVVFLTSKASSDDIKAEMAAGAAAHLSKPINSRVLISTIRNILEPTQ